MAKMIAFYGSPGSGKTSISLKAAVELYCATKDERIQEFVSEARSAWYECQAFDPQTPKPFIVSIEKEFYVRFFDDHYFVDGILNKNFAYGTYPTEKERQYIVSQFKEDILNKLK